MFLTSFFKQNKVNFYVCTFFTIDKYYYVFVKCVNKDIIISICGQPVRPKVVT